MGDYLIEKEKTMKSLSRKNRIANRKGKNTFFDNDWIDTRGRSLRKIVNIKGQRVKTPLFFNDFELRGYDRRVLLNEKKMLEVDYSTNMACGHSDISRKALLKANLPLIRKTINTLRKNRV